MKGLIEQFTKQQNTLPKKLPPLFIKRINRIISLADGNRTKKEIFQIVADEEGVVFTNIQVLWGTKTTPQQKLDTKFKPVKNKGTKDKKKFDKILQKHFIEVLANECSIIITKDLTSVINKHKNNCTLKNITSQAFTLSYEEAKSKGIKMPNCCSRTSIYNRVKSAFINPKQPTTNKKEWHQKIIIWGELKDLFNESYPKDKKSSWVKGKLLTKLYSQP